MRGGALLAAILGCGVVTAAQGAAGGYQPPHEGDFTVRDFPFASGESLPELRLHYRTFGAPRRDDRGVVRNAVLILHGTGGSGASLVRAEFAGELFGPGQPLDASRYFIVLPDGIGHGHSSRPSEGLHARFPHYGYRDMVQAEYLLLTHGLKVNHARLVMGTSMGGMQTWMWGEMHPEFMDALMPLASNPVPIAGRNRMWRKFSVDAIRNDPGFNGGDYTAQPQGLRVAIEMLLFMGSNSMIRQKTLPTRTQVDDYIDKTVASNMGVFDANDLAYALDASWDYDPSADLGKIRAPLLAINSADDLINPPELGTLETGVKQVPQGRSIVIPLSDETVGHGTHTKAIIWKDHLVELLKQTERGSY